MHSIRRILIFLSISFAFSSQTVFAQQQDKEQSKAYMEQAQLMLDAGSIALEDIRDVMIQAADYDTTNILANFEAGHLYLQTIGQDQAAKYFLRVRRQKADYKYDLDYWIAQSYHYGWKFDKAIEFYTIYKNKASHGTVPGSAVKAVEAERRIVECQNGKEFVAAPQNYSIINIGNAINSEYEDYAPVVNGDETELVFTTRRRDGNLNENVFSDNKPWEDIFISTKQGDTWLPAKNIGTPVTTLNHESTTGLSRDGNTLLIYKDDNNGDIYITSRKSATEPWSAPEPLEGINSSTYAEASASLSADGSILYFSSDRPGGLGGFDIYTATRDKGGNWIKVKNLGPGINTPYDEEGPFMDYEGKTLYFSSKGRKGMGGHDIYKATLIDRKDNKWSEPENLGYPINTPDNDIYFVGTKDGKRGYYSSVREDGRGYSDIYRIDVPEAKKVEIIPVKLTVKVFDGGTKTATDAKVSLMANDNTAVGMTSTRAGSYDFSVTSQERKDYKLTIEKDGYIAQTMDINIVGASEQANSVLRVIELRKTDDPKARPTTTESTTSTSTTTTKDKSSAKFSLNVIDAASKQPLDAKVSLTSVKDKKVVAVTNAGTGSYDFAITGAAKDYRLSVEKDGYVFQNIVVKLAGGSTRTVELRKPSVGVSHILHNIYFDFNKATFKQESYDELNKLETMMKQNANMKVEIAGHADSFGSDAYNKKLSLARASAVRKFLTSKGIDPGRVTAAGYGDTRPLASNDDEQGGREINRRVEFKIISN